MVVLCSLPEIRESRRIGSDDQSFPSSSISSGIHRVERAFARRMNCRLFILIVLLLLTVPQRSADAESLAGTRPNVVLIITDDQGYGPIGRHGHPWIRTPSLDALYDKSVRFTRFLVSPTCAPTRAALMTGRHPMRNGVTHTIFERERLTLGATTLAQVLKQVGYTTAIFGKWHLGDEAPYQPQRRGFDEAFIHGAGGIGQAYDCSCADVPANSYFDPVIRHNGTFVKTRGFCTDVFFAAALGFIGHASKTDAPFFAYISTNAPHFPFIAPPENAARFKALGFDKKERGFYGMIENLDENIGRLLEKLEEWQLLDDTLVIFMSDNGMTSRGAGRGVVGKLPDDTPMREYNAGMKGYKGSPNEGGVRVPFFLRWDGRLQAGVDIDRIAAHIDILPTLAELAGAPLPSNQVEGRSLLPLIEHPTADWPDRYLFTHVGRWATGDEPDSHQWQGFSVRNQRFRLVGKDQLYDMRNDPEQATNVIGRHPEVAQEMKTAYDQWWKKTRPMMVNESAPLSQTRPFHEDYARQLQDPGIPDWNPKRL